MIQPIKHNAINWVDGMKVSQTHFNDQDNFIIDSIRDSNSLQINNFNYGILPIAGQFADKTVFEIYSTATNDAQLVIKNCNAITLAGYRIEIKDFSVNVRSLGKNLSATEDNIEGDYYILISVNPFNKIPFGEIDPEETPPRHPSTKPNYSIEMVDVAALNSNLAGGNYIVLGKVNFKSNFAQIDTNFIPPTTALQSHQKQVDYYTDFVRSVSNLQQFTFKIIQKSSHKDQNTALAANVRSLCKVLINTLADSYFQFKNMSLDQPPIYVIDIFSKMALHLYNATQVIPNAELEEMLNYSLEWSEVAPHTFIGQLTLVSEISYDHYSCGEYFKNIQSLLNCLEIVFGKLSELDYIGQRKENIIVTEQEVKSKTDPKKGWSVLD
ncbi:hypothetical protein FNJ88_04095 [Chryseobacterium sp. SNU WT5]|uniref:hypothetical protein n=1 Tax=Chryseobacterium sp. SNU WT5 TaxID=2594269 RepID=UPI00117C931C|nr:hypothetical protein [Chryseobacterium sp. SNU WT5]QDP84770.1 hypothetical protein FNJ88_04095 [Chryseobacterium sp. SNU WT5]